MFIFAKSNEICSSVYMEKEGLIRRISFLEASWVTIKLIVNDRHPQIQKDLRELKSEVKHFF